ncbi:major tail protein [Halobacillus andaensis]|uniref:major tail protein n=1 Tax=Halobacillus andaensis TaxID=1176239 RepID=UPI003D70B505
MALVGLDKLYVAKIEEVDGEETYDTPVHIKDAIDANITPSVDTQNLFADDTVAEIITQFSSVEVSFTINELGSENYALLLGKEKDTNGVVIDSAKDLAPFFAMGFRSKKSNGEYRYVWLYKGKFQSPEEAFQTQADSADHQTQAISGTFVKRGDGQWRARVDSDDEEVGTGTIDGWFDAVYETPEDSI